MDYVYPKEEGSFDCADCIMYEDKLILKFKCGLTAACMRTIDNIDFLAWKEQEDGKWALECDTKKPYVVDLDKVPIALADKTAWLFQYFLDEESCFIDFQVDDSILDDKEREFGSFSSYILYYRNFKLNKLNKTITPDNIDVIKIVGYMSIPREEFIEYLEAFSVDKGDINSFLERKINDYREHYNV